MEGLFRRVKRDGLTPFSEWSPTARFTGQGECFVEIGQGRAGRGGGDFCAEPKPVVSVHAPSTLNDWAKVLFEKDWLWRRF